MELPNETLLEMFREMLRSRRLDERGWVLQRQGKVSVHVSGLGHEATHIGAAYAIHRGKDYVVPYYRDLGLILALGLTAREWMLGLYGKVGEPSSGGRQVPNHFGLRRANIVNTSSPVGTQTPHAAGVALGIKLSGGDEIVLTTIGEGGTSQAEWYEALNWASVHKLPLVCLVENNKYAISVPVDRQMAVSSVAEKAAAFCMPGVSVDGNDLLAVHAVMTEAVQRARRGGGPTLIEARTYRPTPHTSDDDDRSYRSREEVQEWKKRDPILLFRAYLEEKALLTQHMLDEMEAQIKEGVDDAVAFADAAQYPAGEEGRGPVYVEDIRQ